MSSACKAALAIGAFVLLACDERSNAGAAFTKAPSPINQVNVGPVPGPLEQNAEAFRNPFAQDPDSLHQGRQFFVQYNCAGCHGDHGGGGMGPSLRDEQWLYGGSHAQIARSIHEGRAYGMPAWGTMLTPAQIWQITAYIKSMRTKDEPDPPVG